MQNTMSQPARSGSESTIFAPSFASGSAFARVRFHTVSSQPPFARRRAISKPMRPVPIQPSFAALAAVISALLGNSFRRGLDHGEHRPDGYRRTRRNQNRLEHTARNRGNLGGHLVGLDVEQRFVSPYRVAHLLVPVGNRAFGHRFA